MEQRHELDAWLDDALASHGEVAVPTGLEARMLARLREQATSRVSWIPLVWVSACGVVALVVGLAAIPLTSIDAPAPLRAEIVIPRVRKVAIETANREPRRRKVSPVSTRGMPIVVSGLSAQEHAILAMVRKSQERELALLAVQQKQEAEALQKSRQDFENERREK